MITKFNLFENQGLGQRYWKVLIDDNLFVSLTKIDMPDFIQNDLYAHYCDLQDNIDFKFVMVGKDFGGGEMPDWHWDFNQNIKNNNNFYCDPNDNFEYKGFVEVTQDEINDWKLKNDASKYNV